MSRRGATFLIPSLTFVCLSEERLNYLQECLNLVDVILTCLHRSAKDLTAP